MIPRWIQAVRVFAIALATQPAAAALIHNTTIRYPVIGAIVTAAAAVEAYLLLPKGPTPEEVRTLGYQMGTLLPRAAASGGQTTGEPMSADRTPPAPPS